MRIALFTDTFPPDINGVANSTYILRNELERHGHTVFVVTTYAGAGHAKWDDDGKILRLAGLELKFLYGYVATTPFHHAAEDEIRKLNLDVIHAQTEFGVGIFARLVAKSLKIPLVSTYHTTYEDYTHYVNFMNSRKFDEVAKKAVAKISRLYGDSSMEVIAPSEKTKDMLIGYHIRRNINVIPTGLPLDEFDPSHVNEAKTKEIRQTYGFTENERVIIYVGRLAEEKSLDLVVRGFAKAKEQGCDAMFLIVGDGPDTERLNQMISDLKLENNVHLAGPKPKEEIPDYYRSADAFVSASLTETQGMTFIEAMASGLPLFARKDEVLDNLLIDQKTGWYFTNEDDLAEKIRNFESMDQKTLDHMKKEARKQCEPMNSEMFYEHVMKVYERVIDSYHHQYTVTDVLVKDSTVQLYLISNRREEQRMQVSLDDYYEMGIRKGGTLTSNQVEELEYRQNGALAYQRCLRKLSVHDRTRKEIYDWLSQNTKCDISTINQIVERLEDKGYLNDERYCQETIEKMKASLAGHDKIVRYLRKKGIPVEMIEEKLSARKDDEEENAMAYAEKVLNTHRNDSVRKTKNTIRSKMIAQGFSSDLTEATVASLDFARTEKNETENLRKCAWKAKRRYARKYSGSELRNRVFNYCATQGYTSADIYAVIDEMEWNDED